MTKEMTAARMNANDLSETQLFNRRKATELKTKPKTFKLTESNEPGIYYIVDPAWKHLASLVAGTGGRWQLLSADCTSFHSFDAFPKLADCLAVL